MRFLLSIAFVGLSLSTFSQGSYPGVVGDSTTDAIHKDSSIIQAWASACVIQRGWQDIANKNLGLATVGNSSLALGKALTNGVVSLGDSGVATLQFNGMLYDGPGPDFAIFENSFSNTFLELAFVEVSSDGLNFFRFPSRSLSDTTTQINGFGSVNARNVNNLAGKYVAGYGTPFDLSDLAGIQGLDLQNISHIRIIDVIGSLADSVCNRDGIGWKINDPYPTPFPSSGFDLDAVGVMYMKAVGLETALPLSINIYPNPTSSILLIEGLTANDWDYRLIGLDGMVLKKGSLTDNKIDLSMLSRGQYVLNLNNGKSFINRKIVLID